MSREKLAVYQALLFTGDQFIDVDQVTARNLFIAALEGFTFMDIHRSRGQCIAAWDVAQRKGDTIEAVEQWNSARPLFERSLQAKDVAAIDMRLMTVGQGHYMLTSHLPAITREEDAESSKARV
ncbi:hypothetical protein B0H16DRAFT_1463907 [Mycena metata]|uniref:Uncharacterized protein n=1 Tax=Mycena metata TaxID=1033252 RepID=A0AAD7IGU6_9AGAR|nr:hypothetical protein B0H16DRAFT_1463907 [Mycena metata]